MYQIEELINRIPVLLKEFNEKQIEREEVASMIILAFFSKKNIFLLGEPGVSKTGILEIFSTILKDGKTFSWTIKDDTKYEELFGDRYRDDGGKLIYDTEESIVDSHITIIDEIWKGNSKILNSLLSATSNDRYVEIRGRGRIHIPNITTCAASNELPTDVSLKALKDRFNIMMKVLPIKDNDNWIKFISRDYDTNKTLKTTFFLNEVEFIYIKSNEITISESIYLQILKIKNTIKSQDIKCSDRRFDGISEILKVCALLNKRKEVLKVDLFLLVDMIWEIETDIPKVDKLINEIVFGISDEIKKIINENKYEFKMLNTKKEGNFSNFLTFQESYSNDSLDKFENNINEVKNLCFYYEKLHDKFKGVVSNYNYVKRTEKEITENMFIHNI